jgi:hypothetical protein
MAMAGSAVVLAGESFTATASMKTDAASATAAVKISIDRYATRRSGPP